MLDKKTVLTVEKMLDKKAVQIRVKMLDKKAFFLIVIKITVFLIVI